MAIIEDFYQKVVNITSCVCDVDPDLMFRSNREPYVDARSLVIMRLAANGYSDNRISCLTGLTRQAVNHIRNTFPHRFNRSWMLITYDKQISIELAKEFQ